MLNKLMILNDVISGGISSAVSGVFGASEDHRQFLSSGYRCGQCGARLHNAAGSMKLNYYTADGRKMPIWKPTLLADTVGCPNCNHRWKMWGSTLVASAPMEVMGVVETERSEEFFGEDRRVIDNTMSSTQLTRSFSFSKEWSKSCHVDFERAQGEGAELSLGAKEAAALKLSSEEKVRQTYSVSQETKETCVEEVSCAVPARTKLSIVVRWKRIWQHGLVQAAQGGMPLQIPFRVAVGMTFDQQQIEEEVGKTAG